MDALREALAAARARVEGLAGNAGELLARAGETLETHARVEGMTFTVREFTCRICESYTLAITAGTEPSGEEVAIECATCKRPSATRRFPGVAAVTVLHLRHDRYFKLG